MESDSGNNERALEVAQELVNLLGPSHMLGAPGQKEECKYYAHWVLPLQDEEAMPTLSLPMKEHLCKMAAFIEAEAQDSLALLITSMFIAMGHNPVRCFITMGYFTAILGPKPAKTELPDILSNKTSDEPG
jgi:hypothetical protein